MFQNIQQLEYKQNAIFCLCLWSVMICLPDPFLFGRSDWFACLSRMLLFATCAVTIIALILPLYETTWKTEDGEEIAYYQKLIAASLYIYTLLVYLQQFLREASCIAGI